MQLFLSSQSFSRGLKGQDQNNRSQILPHSQEKCKAYKVGQPKPSPANINSLPLSQLCKKNYNQLIVRITRDSIENFFKEIRPCMFPCLLREKEEVLPAYLKPRFWKLRIITQSAYLVPRIGETQGLVTTPAEGDKKRWFTAKY